MQGRPRQQALDGGLFPRLKRIMEAPDVIEAGGFGYPASGDRLHQRDGAPQREHVGDQQVDDEGHEADAVLPRPRHGFGELSPGSGTALGAVLDLGIDLVLDDLEDDIEADAPFVCRGRDAGQIGAAGFAGLDGDRLPGGDFPEIGSGLMTLFLRAGSSPGTRRGLVLVIHLRWRDAGVPAGFRGGPFKQDGDQDAQQGHQDPDHGVDFAGQLAGRTQGLDVGPRGLELVAQRLPVHRRHDPASTAMTAASTARRSPGGIAA